MLTVESSSDLLNRLAETDHNHYVYILRWPDGQQCWNGWGTPFYVGIGQGMRVFSHERQAQDERIMSAKVHAIRAIWADQREVVRQIEGFYANEPWGREETLINEIGTLASGKGPLTNAQDYSPSVQIEGVELRKYTKTHASSGDAKSTREHFKLHSTRLRVGPNSPKSMSSVFGKLVSLLEKYPGITGQEFLRMALDLDFQSNKSAYTQSGSVCASWVAGYIEGGFFRADTGYFQTY